MPAGTTDGGEVHLGAAAHALVLRSSPWHTCGPSGIILGGLWVLGLLLWWLGLQGTGHLEGPWGRRTQASTRGASSDQGWSGVFLYVRSGPKGPGGEVPAPPSAAEWPENPERLRITTYATHMPRPSPGPAAKRGDGGLNSVPITTHELTVFISGRGWVGFSSLLAMRNTSTVATQGP